MPWQEPVQRRDAVPAAAVVAPWQARRLDAAQEVVAARPWLAHMQRRAQPEPRQHKGQQTPPHKARPLRHTAIRRWQR